MGFTHKDPAGHRQHKRAQITENSRMGVLKARDELKKSGNAAWHAPHGLYSEDISTFASTRLNRSRETQVKERTCSWTSSRGMLPCSA